MACSQGCKRPNRARRLGASVDFELYGNSRASLHYCDRKSDHITNKLLTNSLLIIVILDS
jgi:hypothetical protein